MNYVDIFPSSNNNDTTWLFIFLHAGLIRVLVVVQNYILKQALMPVQLFSRVTHSLFQIKVGVRDADFDLKSTSEEPF